MDKYTIFREMMDYLADVGDVTDADMNYYPGGMKLVCETDGQVITMDICITEKKEEKENA